jgi:hypothetical protein
VWIVAGVWEHAFGIKCEEERKEGKGPQLECFLGKEGRKSLSERTGGLEELGRGRPIRRGFIGRIWIKSCWEGIGSRS